VEGDEPLRMLRDAREDLHDTVFHCRANAKKEMQNRENALSFRVEFCPRLMKTRGQPDL
jgi:hypothetical protein